MTTSTFSEFEILLLRSDNKVASAIFLILAWIAASDGNIDDSEAQAIVNIAEASQYDGDIRTLIAIAQQRDVVALQLASEIIKLYIKDERGVRLFLMMSIRVAVADGHLLPTENYILRFIGDLVGLSLADFNHVFHEATGRDIPNPPDMSSAEYWQMRENAKRRFQRDSKTESSDTRTHGNRALRFYGVLGLKPSATQKEIKMAYRRLAMSNHPDRFESLGKEAKATAEESMKRINEAYEYLKHA